MGVNAQAASLSAYNQYSDMGRGYSYDVRSAQREAEQALASGRGAQGTTLASAGASGFAGRSFTVGSLMSDIDRQNAESANNHRSG